jgi:universal stress protein A
MTPLPEPRMTSTRAAASGIRRVLLATDLSPASDGATIQALSLCEDLGADLVAVSVIDPRALRLPGGHAGSRVDQVRAAREREAQDLVDRGRQRGIRVAFLIWEGDPGEAIVEAAESEQVDMVVVGSHGRGSVGRLFLGSVSEHVVRNAACPVLVVRARNEHGAASLAN